MTRVAGSVVTLRPFRPGELDRLVALAASVRRDDGIHHGPTERDALIHKIEVSGSWNLGKIEFAIEHEGALVGEVQARNIPHAMPPGVFELGIEIYDDRDKRHGLGAAAVQEITRHLFREEAAIRVQLSTDVDNVGMRRVAERLGFGFEGVQRGFMPTARGPRDYAMYGMTRDDYEARAWT
jgi:RimJ/RimL family protein N-acetyltransferase